MATVVRSNSGAYERIKSFTHFQILHKKVSRLSNDYMHDTYFSPSLAALFEAMAVVEICL